jgi:hypothetical protein
MIDEAASSDPHVREILSRHPKVHSVKECSHAGVDFRMGSWERSVVIGDSSVEIRGLVELMDNNPMVCADKVSVPPPASTLGLVALGPIAWAGLILEPPAVIAMAPAGEDMNPWLTTAGWAGGATTELYPMNDGVGLSLVGIAAIATPDDWSDIDELYDERFSKSFFVRRVNDWTPEMAANEPFATYHLQYTPGDDASLLRISVSASLHGKAGAAQVVHAMNVMAGLEESLGLE